MLKSVEKLLECDNDLTVGNHSSKHNYEIHEVWFYMYHGTVICEVNYERREFKLPYDGAYSHSVSTRRAVNDYKRYFTDKGFTLIEEAV